MNKLLVIFAILCALVLAGCGGSTSGLERMDGQIVWEDGGTLPAGSKVTVMIVNASLADTSDILVQTTFKAEGPSPLTFFVEYDQASVDERVNYSATVRIEDADGSLLYVTKTAQFVIEQGQQVTPINILVEPV